MTDCIIIDIDGTLADNTHRLHLIKGPKKNYDKFNSLVDKDDPIYDVIWLAEKLVTAWYERAEYNNFAIFICSGRPEDHRDKTESWLKIHTPDLFHAAQSSGAILLRASGDYRKDSIVKEEMKQHIEGQGYNIRAVIDDRPQVIQMWKKHGLTVFKVGNWEQEEKKDVNPGALHVMVGPTGAGKSTFVADQFDPAEVISSDDMRRQITGSARNMDKDSLMWGALHKIVQARLEAGADTVVDATNLKNYARKALLDLQYPNGKITYHVINRSLEDKKKTGDWRNGVNVKGKSLIEYHEDVFNSNLKDILNGDGDDRVEVIDYR